MPPTPAEPVPDPRANVGPWVGIDVGATLAKLAVRNADGAERLELLPASALHAIGQQVAELGAQSLGLVGGGAAELAEQLSGPCICLPEFDAWRAGAAYLLARDAAAPRGPYLLVSLGTGTSVLRVEGETAVRVGGTALGGGTLVGLGATLTGAASFEELCALAGHGSRAAVDLLVSDIYTKGDFSLPGEITAAAFGKLAPSQNGGARHAPPSAADLAAGVMGLVGENVALITGGIASAAGIECIVFGGTTLRSNPVLVELIRNVCRALGREARFLSDGEFAGAIGALDLARRMAAPARAAGPA